MSGQPSGAQVDTAYYEVARPNSLAERIVGLARDRIFADFIRLVGPRPEDSILDVGVSDVITNADNVLERNYAHPARITAAGLGTGEAFKAAYPKVAYRQIAPNQPLPFADRSFDIATANAVLEHVGSTEHQRVFLAELCRVADRVFVTVPHRFFPVEHHTGIPFLHWLDTTFGMACAATGKTKWARRENLILMSRQRLAAVCPPTRRFEIGSTGILLGPFSANLWCYLTRQDA